jgi:hypothetical protein
MDKFYGVLENKLKIKVDFKKPILRKFFSIEEQNNWFIASDKVELAPFLSTELVTKKYSGIDALQLWRSAAYRTRRYSSSIGKYREYLVSNNLF